MKNLNLFAIVVAFFFATAITNAQNIAISDVAHTADASAVLDVYSTSLGMLVPRLTADPTTPAPAKGLLYYNINSNSFRYNAGTSASPNWTELSFGNLWSRAGTDTYLSNLTDNVVIGTNSSLPGYKFYVFGATSQMSRFDGQVEFWNTATGVMTADVNTTGPGHGVFSVYDNTGTKRIELNSMGVSYLQGSPLGIGNNSPQALLHVTDNNGFGAPQLFLENLSGTANTGIRYKYGAIDYSQGIEPTTGNFVLANTSTIGIPVQSDGASMVNVFNNGIVDFNNQSRTRVFLPEYQQIPNAIWHPIDFNATSYDQHAEWTLGAGSPNGGPPMSFFTATEEGYYQVNARTAYFLGEEGNNYWVNQDAYVSIAIYKCDVTGTWNMYAQGNNLQIGQIWNPQGGFMEEELSFKNNNAPNVSDVVYLQKGEKIAIYTWQDAGFPLNLKTGQAKTYCSVHKSS